MDYSLLLGVHVMDQNQRDGGEPGQAGGDGKRPVGQRVLYSTAMESIQGDGKAAEALTTDDTWVGSAGGKHTHIMHTYLGIHTLPLSASHSPPLLSQTQLYNSSYLTQDTQTMNAELGSHITMALQIQTQPQFYVFTAVYLTVIAVRSSFTNIWTTASVDSLFEQDLRLCIRRTLAIRWRHLCFYCVLGWVVSRPKHTKKKSCLSSWVS